MKIITPGQPKKKIYRAKCQHCGCEFEYEEAEVKYVDAVFTSVLILKCPEVGCGKMVAPSSAPVREEEVKAEPTRVHQPSEVRPHG